jgi:hypothetical protein
MSKRNTVSVTLLSAFALTMICLLSAVTTAQKATQGTTGSVTPVKGIDVIVMDNSGNIVNRLSTNDKGEVKFVGLAPGNYSLTIVDPSKQERYSGGQFATSSVCSFRMNGVVGGPIEREWNIKESKFVTLSNATTRAATPAPSYEEKINFEIGTSNPPPVVTMSINKSRSNVKGND